MQTKTTIRNENDFLFDVTEYLGEPSQNRRVTVTPCGRAGDYPNGLVAVDQYIHKGQNFKSYDAPVLTFTKEQITSGRNVEKLIAALKIGKEYLEHWDRVVGLPV